MKTLALLTLATFIHLISSNLNAASQRVGWTCFPQQNLIGQWIVEVYTDQNPIQGVTHFSPEVGLEMKPFVQKIALAENLLEDSQIEYLGDAFHLTINPNQSAAHSVFGPNETAVDAMVVHVKYGPRAELFNRPFACVYKIYERLY